MRIQQLMTVEDLGRLLQRSKPSIYQMRTRGQIPTECVVVLGPKSIRFKRAAIDRWLESLRGEG